MVIQRSPPFALHPLIGSWWETLNNHWLFNLLWLASVLHPDLLRFAASVLHPDLLHFAASVLHPDPFGESYGILWNPMGFLWNSIGFH